MKTKQNVKVRVIKHSSGSLRPEIAGAIRIIIFSFVECFQGTFRFEVKWRDGKTLNGVWNYRYEAYSPKGDVALINGE